MNRRKRCCRAVTAARLPVSVALPAATALLAPEPAQAHGIVGQTDLPVPGWMFAWAAAIVLAATFVALGVLWRTPQLQEPDRRRVGALPRALDPVCGALGVAAFAGLMYCGLAGAQVPAANLLPTAAYVIFWVAIPIVSAVLGDVFRPFNPWRATGRAAGAAIARVRRTPEPVLAYPERVGRWPAVAGIVAFGWLELVSLDGDLPRTLAILALAYALLQTSGVALCGDARWTDRADAFAVYFRLFARAAPLEVRGGVLYRRRPLSGLPGMAMPAGTVALVCAAIGITTFDGASNSELWLDVAPSVESVLSGLGQAAAVQLTGTLGLALALAGVGAVYWFGVTGMTTVAPGWTAPDLARRFCHTLVPIALAYVVAHYFSLLVYQGQAAASLISDPLGDGADLLGTAGWQVDYRAVSATAIWWVQIAALLIGHVGGLVLAHDRALATFRPVAVAVRSQYWMLVVMVGFTCFGLWLLSAVAT